MKLLFSLDQSLIEAYKAGVVTEETAMFSCTNKGKTRRELDLIQRGRGVCERTKSVRAEIKYSGTDSHHRSGRSGRPSGPVATAKR